MSMNFFSPATTLMGFFAGFTIGSTILASARNLSIRVIPAWIFSVLMLILYFYLIFRDEKEANK